MNSRKHPFLQDLRKNRTKWLMLLPAAVVVILMCYIPMAGVVLAFKEFNYHDGISEVRGSASIISSIFLNPERPGLPQGIRFFITLRSCA